MEEMIEFVKSEALLFDSSLHGLKHWRNVEKIGMFLCQRSGADVEVVRTFAYVHDVGRRHDGGDYAHGKRSARIVRQMAENGILSYLDEDRLQQLYYACEHHSERYAESDDVTVRTCWDSDRLDLWRLGVAPDKELLFTDAGKTEEASQYAKSLQS